MSFACSVSPSLRHPPRPKAHPGRPPCPPKLSPRVSAVGRPALSPLCFCPTLKWHCPQACTAAVHAKILTSRILHAFWNFWNASETLALAFSPQILGPAYFKGGLWTGGSLGFFCQIVAGFVADHFKGLYHTLSWLLVFLGLVLV